MVKVAKTTSAVTKKEVLKLIHGNIETKHKDSTAFTGSILSSGGFTLLSDIVPGDLDSNRVGTKIDPFKMSFRGEIIGADTPYNRVRVIVFQWHENDDNVPPDISYILQNVANEDQRLTSQYRWDKRNEFTILYDHLFHLVIGQDSVLQHMSFSVDKMRKIKYNEGNVSTAESNVYLYMVSDSTAAPYPLINGCFRLLYKDA